MYHYDAPPRVTWGRVRTLAVRTLPAPQSYIIGFFLFLVAAALAVSPLPLVYRSTGILLMMYLTFSVAGMPFVYLTALLAPPVGLLSGDTNWLVMLPIVMASALLGALGLEYAWRYPALVSSHPCSWCCRQSSPTRCPAKNCSPSPCPGNPPRPG